MLHHVVDGPGRCPDPRPLELPRYDPRDVGAPDGSARAALPRRPVRPSRSRRLSRLAGPTTIDALGGDLVALLDALSLERVSFCGLSLGGVEGMWLAENAPERVDRLALCCTAASFPPRQGWVDRAAVVRGERHGGDRGRRARSVVHARRFTTSTPTSWRGSARCSRPSRRRGMPPAATRSPTSTSRLGWRRSARRRWSSPATTTPSFPRQPALLCASAIPHARHVGIPGAHLANVEAEPAFTAALLGHLTGEKGEA